MRHERIVRAIAIAELKLAAKPGSTLRRRQRVMNRELGHALLDIGAKAIVASIVRGLTPGRTVCIDGAWLTPEPSPPPSAAPRPSP